MEIPNVEQLLDYVFTTEDFGDDPSTQEYKKLVRVMKVMVNFYKRGEKNKGIQHEMVLKEVETLNRDIQMVLDQKLALSSFPIFHPKRSEYEGMLENEHQEMIKFKKRYEAQAENFSQLHSWGQNIVESVEWLEGNLKHYANQKLGMTFDIEPIKISTEEYKKYKRGLEEITYNLQESQDFFEASLDGRLRQYHEIEKKMIEAQIAALQKYPPVSERRKHVEAELEKDLEYVSTNMIDNPQVQSHREKMQAMHKDFFAILKWQRKKMLQILDKEPEKIIGDIAQLKEDLEKMKLEAEEKAFLSKFGGVSLGSTTSDHSGEVMPNDELHRNLTADQMASGGGCPVPHGQASMLLAQKKAEEIATKKESGLIHKVYDPTTDKK
jgi:hypothetical protein